MEEETKVTDAEFTEVKQDEVVPEKEESEADEQKDEIASNEEAPETLGVNVEEKSEIGDRMA